MQVLAQQLPQVLVVEEEGRGKNKLLAPLRLSRDTRGVGKACDTRDVGGACDKQDEPADDG